MTTPQHRAFTLLEVLLAMSILAMVTVGILMTFRTAAHTYERSDGLMISLQATRAVADSVGRDIRATFYVDEEEYGVELNEDEQEDPSATQQPLVVSDLVAEDRDLEEEEEEIIDDPRMTVDISFRINEGGDFDSIEFVRRLRRADSRRSVPWGLARTTYTIEDDPDGDSKILVRQVQPVFYEMPIVVQFENETYDEAVERSKEEAPRPDPITERLASGIELFDVRCLIWADGEWIARDEWDSQAKDARNPYRDLVLDPDDPNYEAILAAEESLPEDGLPSALEINMALRPQGGVNLGVTRLVIPLFPAQETWVPADPQLVDT